MFNAAITADKLILIGIFLLVAFPVHEFAHAFVAYRLGDATAKLFGRLTLNPIAHFDPLGGLLLVVSVLLGGFVIGFAKPTPVNPSNLVDRRNSEVAVALAGPASNLVMAAVMGLVIRGLDTAQIALPSIVNQVLFGFVFFNVVLTFVNLIPVPPLDGSSLLYRVLSPEQAWRWRPLLTQYGLMVAILVLYLLGPSLISPIQNVASFLVGR